jgi:hypothetical protein
MPPKRPKIPKINQVIQAPAIISHTITAVRTDENGNHWIQVDHIDKWHPYSQGNGGNCDKPQNQPQQQKSERKSIGFYSHL